MIRLAAALTLLAGPAFAQYFYSSRAFAQKNCPKDQVVWLNATTHVYYFHNDPLYGMTEGTAMAFFELQKRYNKTDDGIPTYLKHVALSCDSADQLRAWHRHFEAHGLHVLGEIDHEGIWLSIYVTEPSGLIIEITYQGHSFYEDDVKEGLTVLKEWRKQKNLSVGK